MKKARSDPGLFHLQSLKDRFDPERTFGFHVRITHDARNLVFADDGRGRGVAHDQYS
jgi:hypothetical protein